MGAIRTKLISPNTRPSFLRDLLQKCKQPQRDAAAAAGFEFLWSAPLTYEPNRVLAAWLLCCIDSSSALLRLYDDLEYPVRVEDVKYILGIPQGSATIPSSCNINYDYHRRNVAALLSHGYPRSTLSLSRCRSVLISLHCSDTLTSSEERAFVTSLIIFAVSTFLAPLCGTRSDTIDRAVVLALSDPDKIKTIDWATYTLTALFSSSDRAKLQLSPDTTERCIKLDGCMVFLNVNFYPLLTYCLNIKLSI